MLESFYELRVIHTTHVYASPGIFLCASIHFSIHFLEIKFEDAYCKPVRV